MTNRVLAVALTAVVVLTLGCSGGGPDNTASVQSGGETGGTAGGSAECPAGHTLCDGSCVLLDSNSAHCGSCGNQCPAGQACSGGVCTAAGSGGTSGIGGSSGSEPASGGSGGSGGSEPATGGSGGSDGGTSG